MEKKETMHESIKKKLADESKLRLPPWDLVNFFMPGKILQEDEMYCSINEICKRKPKFEKEYGKYIDELKRILCIAVTGMKNIPISSLVDILQTVSKQPDSLPFFPSFPKQPSVNILEFFLSTIDSNVSASWTDGEKEAKFAEFCKSDQRCLTLLTDWKKQLNKYVNGLEKYKKDHSSNLNQSQLDRIEICKTRAKSAIPTITSKIDEKRAAVKKEMAEFNKFYAAISRDEKYAQLTDIEKTEIIKRLYEESDESIRRYIVSSCDLFPPDVKPSSSSFVEDVKHVIKKSNPKNSTDEKDANSSTLSNSKNVKSRPSLSPRPAGSTKKSPAPKKSRAKPIQILQRPEDTVLSETSLNANSPQLKKAAKRKVSENEQKPEVVHVPEVRKRYSMFDEQPLSQKRNRKMPKHFDEYDAKLISSPRTSMTPARDSCPPNEKEVEIKEERQ